MVEGNCSRSRLFAISARRTTSGPTACKLFALHAADEKPVYRRPRTRSRRLGACPACGLHRYMYPNAKRAAELHAIHVPRSRVASRAKDYVDVIEDMMPHRHDVDELASALGKGKRALTRRWKCGRAGRQTPYSLRFTRDLVRAVRTSSL
jgi:hypothetical protein